jgi:2-dehydro-3-deoxyphosphogluconate aldolase / (4S)-4-hydroxy-2-oxoglutarate aldolase
MHQLFKPEVIEKIQRTGVIAVLVVDQAEDAVPLANALAAGGITVMELTLRTPAAIDALKRIVAEVPEITAGVGTVITPEQVRQISQAGAAFGVAPGLNRRVLDEAKRVGLPFAPGVVTPSDIETALEYNCRLLKFFPAEPAGGLAYLQGMAAPYAHLNIRYIPLGGINEQNMRPYLADPIVAALGGSWLAPRKLIQQKNWTQITENARRAITAVHDIRHP